LHRLAIELVFLQSTLIAAKFYYYGSDSPIFAAQWRGYDGNGHDSPFGLQQTRRWPVPLLLFAMGFTGLVSAETCRAASKTPITAADAKVTK